MRLKDIAKRLEILDPRVEAGESGKDLIQELAQLDVAMRSVITDIVKRSGMYAKR